MSNYWSERIAKAQQAIFKRSERQIKKQMIKYYSSTMKKVITDFENTYNKILAQQEKGQQITPALLYRLDSYWQLQAQTRAELEKMGAKQIALLSKEFELNWFEVYYSINLPNVEATYNTIDKSMVSQMINSIWAADGKSWSQRIWDNTSSLLETLNEGLIHTVAAGKKTTDLKNILQERFGVSYSRADALVRTELAHVQTQAAQKRYEDYGVQQVQIWADEDERRCEVCGKLHEKLYPTGAHVPIPAHPRCRCCIVPYIEK